MKVPLGNAYTSTAGKDCVEFTRKLRFTRDEVRDFLADEYYSEVYVLRKPKLRPYGGERVKDLLMGKLAAGEAPGDEVSNGDEDETDAAYEWADRTLERVWPSA